MAYNVRYNGLNFVNTPFLQNGGCLVLKEFSFYEVPTQSTTEKYAIKHWEYVNPTMLKNRRIRFLFDIIANSEEERWELLNKVQRAFAPERNPNPFNEKLWKDLTFLDVNCKEWKCKCQILQGIQLSDFANEKWIGISAEVITDNTYFYSSTEHEVVIKNTMMGIQLPVNLPFKRKYYKGIIDYNWTISTPLKIELRILDTKNSNYPFWTIKIASQKDDIIEALHIDGIRGLGLNIGDKIIVDTENRRCYYENSNWKSDITGLVKVWSSRPVLDGGRNVIAVDTGVWNECIEATLKWKDLF